jgi:hypothetical protein
VNQPAAAPAAGSKNATKTEYVILRFNDETNEWAEHGDHIRASSSSAAIRKHVDERKAEAGSFIAIPARSFKATGVKVETKTTIKLG